MDSKLALGIFLAAAVLVLASFAISAESTDKPFDITTLEFKDYQTKRFTDSEKDDLTAIGMAVTSEGFLKQDSSIKFLKYDSAGGKFFCPKSYTIGPLSSWESDPSKCLSANSSSFNTLTFVDSGTTYSVTLANWVSSPRFVRISGPASGTDIFLNSALLGFYDFPNSSAVTKVSKFIKCSDNVNGKKICVLLSGDLESEWFSGGSIDLTRVWVTISGTPASTSTGTVSPKDGCATISQCVASMDLKFVKQAFK
ncbi:MAG TPA: hypothetical protein VFF09_04380 [archaeon]|nr:hypothetical protein [archaeon]